MMRFLLTFCFLITPFITYAQNVAKLRGEVINAEGVPEEEVEIYILELDKTSISDTNGKFEFSNLPNSAYTLIATKNNQTYDPVYVDLRNKNEEKISISVNAMALSLEEVHLKTRKISDQLKNNAIKADVVTMEGNLHRANSVEDLVNRVPGVKIRNVGGLGSTSDIIVGGFAGNAVKFLYDDIPIDYLGSNYGLTKIPTNAIGRVEVYKGVLPTKIGVDALGSAINIVPNTIKETSGSVSYETGSYNTHIGTINATVRITDNLYLGTNSFYNYSDNNYKVNNLPYLNVENGQTKYIRAKLFHNAFEQTSMEFFVQGRDLAWADLLEFKVNSYSINQEIQNDSYSRSRPFGEVERKEKGNFIPSLKYKKYLFDSQLSINQFLVYSKLNFELFDQGKNVLYDWKGVANPANSSSEMGNMVLENGYMGSDLEQFISRTHLNYLLSDNFQLENNTVFSNYNLSSNTDKLNPDGTTYNKLITSFALNSQFLDRKLESNTQIKYLYSNLSGRYEASDNPLVSASKKANSEKTGISFAQALKYNFNPKNYIRASYENTYRLPEQQELFGDNNFVVANYNLVPERSKNINLGYTRIGDKYSFEINTYYRDTKDLIRLKDLNQYQATYLNLDHVRGLGVEFEINYEPFEDLLLTGNLTWNDFRLESSKDELLQNQYFKNARVANMPFYYANLGASYNLKDLLNLSTDLSFFWDYSYVHQYYLDFIEKQFEPDGFLGLWGTSKINTSRTIPVQHLNNLGIVYVRNFGEQTVAFSAELKNVFNEEIYNEFKMQSPGRNFRLKVTYSF